MMTAAEALHTAARRYCQDRIRYWHQRYAEWEPHQYQPDYREEEKAIYPRYDLLGAVLVEVERLRPEDFKSLEEARERLVLVGQTAESVFTKRPKGQTEQRVMHEERDLFCDYIQGLGDEALPQIVPLLYHRTLTEEERQGALEACGSAVGNGGTESLLVSAPGRRAARYPGA